MKFQYITPIIDVLSMIFFIYEHIAEQNAVICSPNMIIGDHLRMITAPEPTVCALCRNNEGVKIHAPCIVNLATGEVAELAIYDPHPTEIGEVTETPKKGHVSYFTGAGALIEQNPDQGYCKATLAKEEPIGPGYFCYECRRKISEIDKDKKAISLLICTIRYLL